MQMWKPGRPRIGLRKPAHAAGAACGTAASAVKTASLLEVLLRHPCILPETAGEGDAAPGGEESPDSNSAETAVVLPDAAVQLRSNSCSAGDQRSRQQTPALDAQTSAKLPATKPQLRSMPKPKTTVTVIYPANINQLQQQDQATAGAAAAASLPQAIPAAPEAACPTEQPQACCDSSLLDGQQHAEQQLQLAQPPVLISSEQVCEEDWPMPTKAWAQGQMLGGRFRIINKLGSGGFATVYRALDVYNGFEVAVKVIKHDQSDGVGLLPMDAKDNFWYPSLGREFVNFKTLGAVTSGSRPPTMPLPLVFEYERAWQMPLGRRTSDGFQLYSYMALELGGPSMWWLGTKGTYSKDPARFVEHATGMLQGLQWLHSKGWVHNDVKSANFITAAHSALAPDPPVFLIDLGFAKRMAGIDPTSPFKDAADIFSGTPDYSSVRCLRGFPCAPCDDLTALSFCLLEMATGSVPWHLTRNAATADNWSHKQLLDMAQEKEDILQRLFLEGKLPAFFGEFYNYTSSLQPEDSIDYAYLQQLIQQAPSTSKPWCSRKRPAEDLLPAAAAAVASASEQQPSSNCQQPADAVPEQAEVQEPPSKRLRVAELAQEAATTEAGATQPMQPQEAACPSAAEDLQAPEQQLQAALQSDAAAEAPQEGASAGDMGPQEKVQAQPLEVLLCEE